jgi:NAD(P)-dependent dehydrogenase (short-subunit alcohol dehydrogenase family)
MRVIADASSIDTYTGLSNKHLFDFEYWPSETYKVTLLPPEKEMSRRTVLVTGAAGAIGREVAKRFVSAGAAVILTDVNAQKLRELSAELNVQSGEDNTVAVPMDVTDEGSVANTFREAILAYRGLDVLVSNARIARSQPGDSLSYSDWNESFAVNATGHFSVCREAARIFERQGLGGNIDAYCITRNLLKVKVTAQDVAEAVLFLAADRSPKTTGAMIPADGGIKEAFPR